MGKNNIFAIQKIGYDKDTSSIFGGGDMANVVEPTLTDDLVQTLRKDCIDLQVVSANSSTYCGKYTA